MRLASSAFIAILCLATPALAFETFDCADAKGEVALEFDYQHGEAPFRRVQMQIVDDIGISTDPVHDDFDGDYLGKQVSGQDFEGVDVNWKDEKGREHKAMSLRLVIASEGQVTLVTGALAVDGGGVWPVSCAVRGGRSAAEVW